MLPRETAQAAARVGQGLGTARLQVLIASASLLQDIESRRARLDP